MNFFEMIYHSGPEDFECDFYKSNTEKSRRHFFNQMLKDAKQDLENYKADPHDEMDDYLSKSYQESVDVLHRIKDEFIKKGTAKSGSYISFCVAERTIKDV